MPLRPSIRHFIAPAFWFAVVICAFLPARFCSFTAPLHDIASAAVNPPARLLTLIGSSFRGRDDQPIIDKNLQRLSGEILYLNGIIERYQQENERLRLDNQTLQELSKTLGRRSFLFRLAQVMSRSVNPSNRAITLNLGTRNGLSDGLGVVSGPNLVGRITNAGPVTSDVKLITSAGQKIEAVLMPRVLPQGRPPADRANHPVLFESDGSEYLVAKNVPRDAPVQVGDIAHLRDSEWPAEVQGMVLGQVVDITPEHDPVLRKKITIRTLRALVYLDQVTVIVPREVK